MDAKWALAGFVALVVIIFVAGGNGAFSSLTGGGDDPAQTNGSSDEPVEFTEKKWINGYTVPLDVKAPVSSDLQADIFVAEPESDGDYGDYVDYNRTDATSGMTQGVDYFHQDGAGIQTLTFDPETSIDPGTYKIAIDDNASTEEYHTLFKDITVPSLVEFNKYDNDVAERIIKESDFDRRPGYDSDTYSLYKGSGTSNGVDFSDKDGAKDLATSAYGSGEETFTVQRQVEYTHGMDYLGEVNFITANSTANTDITLTIEATKKDGSTETVFDEEIASDGSSNDFDEVIPDVDDDELNPLKVKDLEATMEVTFDGGSVSNGDVLANASIRNIYGNEIGTDKFISLTS